MKDWLYNITGSCPDEAVPNSWWDNDASSSVSGVLLWLFFVSACVAMLAAGNKPRRPRRTLVEYDFGVGDPVHRVFSDREALRQVPANALQTINTVLHRPPKERMWHLDFARIVCVTCVITEHSGGSMYSDRNVVFVLQWVLPYLFLTSGMCFMLSSAPLWYYVSRLFLVLVIGVGFNLFADIKQGHDWKHDFGSTVYQMFYVVFLILLAFVGGPLRRALKWRFSNPDAPNSRKLLGVAAGHGLLAFIGFVFLLAGYPLIWIPSSDDPTSWAARAKLMFDNSAVIAAGTGGCAFLAALACLVNASPWHSWILLAAIYIPRVFCPFALVGFSHNVDLYLFGMVTAKWGIKGNDQIVAAVRAYWPLMLALLMLLMTPEVTGRCDVNPARYVWERFRFYFTEFVLTVCFVSGAFNTSDPWNWTGWLNAWALWAYISHVAWYRLFPVPGGALLTYGSLLPFWMWHKYKARQSTIDSDSNWSEPAEGAEGAEGQCSTGASSSIAMAVALGDDTRACSFAGDTSAGPPHRGSGIDGAEWGATGAVVKKDRTEPLLFTSPPRLSSGESTSSGTGTMATAMDVAAESADSQV